MLRSKNYAQLGEIKRLYMETSGVFSFYKAKEAGPGLSLYPDEDKPLYNEQPAADGKKVCYDCGKLYNASAVPVHCENCKGSHFINAVKK